eukprot:GHVH01010610.1.p1 GENE.GHVH01010610.1~~GHVH01010610.1.p1  ORF type:complete len:530 (-),score=76.71 GHVH01010610.1:85-1674(-)
MFRLSCSVFILGISPVISEGFLERRLQSVQPPVPPMSSSVPPSNFTDETSLTIYTSGSGQNFEPANYIGRSVDLRNQSGNNIGGYAIVTQKNRVSFDKANDGVYHGALEGVAEHLDPTTVSYQVVEDPTAHILKQSFQFDLITPEKVLDYYLNKSIKLSNKKLNESISGELLSHDYNNIIVKNYYEDIMILPRADTTFELPKLPADLRTKPTLQLEMKSELHSGSLVQNDLITTYKTSGINWRADYNVTISQDEKSASIGAWVSILNLTGKAFENAQLKLIAGDVNTVDSSNRPMAKTAMLRSSPNAPTPAFKEKSFFEFHMYTLPTLTTLKNASLNQLVLIPTSYNVAVKKELIYQPIKSNSWGEKPNLSPPQSSRDPNVKKVPVTLAFANKSENQLGIPMPKGKVRVFKEDGISNEFIGEDLIDHTSRDEIVNIKLGNSFDVKADREVTDFTVNGNFVTETVEFTIRNQKDFESEIIIKDLAHRWMNYVIKESSPEFADNGSGLLTAIVMVPSQGESVVRYTVEYNI